GGCPARQPSNTDPTNIARRKRGNAVTINSSDATAIVTRLRAVETQLNIERHKRQQAEMKIGGLRSAVSRLSSLLAKQKAEQAKGEAKGEAISSAADRRQFAKTQD